MISQQIVKNKCVYLIMLTSLVTSRISVHAQSWSLTGNAGTSPAVNFLGTTDSKALALRTNKVERMRISASGLVGIGLNNPTLAKLVTNGSVGNTLAIFWEFSTRC